jgi:prevent-host-death family protein
MALDSLADIDWGEGHSAQLQSFTRTALAGEIQKVSKAVLAQGEVVITSHNKPEMVLMTVERYVELQEAGRPSLDHLTQEFDQLVARMQRSSAPAGAAAAFELDGAELGRIARQAAQPR